MEGTFILPSTLPKTECLEFQGNVQFIQEDLHTEEFLKDEPIFENMPVLDTDENLEVMIDDVGHSAIFKCNECSYETTNESHITIHKKIHRKTYRCNLCSYKCSTEGKLQYHKKMQHSNSEDVLYFCGDCDFTSTQKKVFQQHRREQHKREYTGSLECEKCDFKTNTQYRMQRHSKVHLSVEERLVECPKCSYNSLNQKSIKMHCRKKHPEMYFSCDICSRSYKIEEDYKRHMERHNWPTEDGRYVCKQCDYRALTLQTIMRHIKEIHEGQTYAKKLRYRCDKCPYKTDRRLRIEQHEKIHTTDNVLKCPKCPYVAFNLAALGKHRNKSHREEEMLDITSSGKKVRQP